MSTMQEITRLVAEAGGNTSSDEKYHGVITSAMEEVANLLKGTQDSLSAICRDVEAAASKEEELKWLLRGSMGFGAFFSNWICRLSVIYG